MKNLIIAFLIAFPLMASANPATKTKKTRKAKAKVEAVKPADATAPTAPATH